MEWTVSYKVILFNKDQIATPSYLICLACSIPFHSVFHNTPDKFVTLDHDTIFQLFHHVVKFLEDSLISLRKKVEPKRLTPGAVSWYVTQLHPWHQPSKVDLFLSTPEAVLENGATSEDGAIFP